MSGVAMAIPLSEQLRVEFGPLSAQHAFLMATDTPINLLQRDLLCKLNCTVKCTPEGVYLDILHESHITMLNLLQENTENLVYRWAVTDCEASNHLPGVLVQFEEERTRGVRLGKSTSHRHGQGADSITLHCRLRR